MVLLLIGVFLVSFVLANITMLKLLRADNTGPSIIFAVGATLIVWAVLNGGIK